MDSIKNLLNLTGKEIVLHTRKGFRYAGTVVHETPGFLVLQDDRTNRRHYINFEEIGTLDEGETL